MAPKTRHSKAKAAKELPTEIPPKMGRTKGKGKRKEKGSSSKPTQPTLTPVPATRISEEIGDPIVPMSNVEGSSAPTRQGSVAAVEGEPIQSPLSNVAAGVEGEIDGSPVSNTVPPLVNVPLQESSISESYESVEEHTNGSESSEPEPPLRSYSRDARPVVSSAPTRNRAPVDDADLNPMEETEARPSKKKVPRAPPKRRRNVEEVGAHLALEFKFYNVEAKEYHASVVSRLGFFPEVSFKSNALRAANWGDYLVMRNVMAWGSKFFDCNFSLVRELYANLSPSFADSTSIWYGKVYVRGKIISINLIVLCNLLELPSQPFLGIFPHDNQFAESSVVRTLTQGKLSSFAERRLSSSVLSLKFFLGFKLCSSCALPSKNHTYISKSMANLIYAVERRIPINFPQLIMTQMAARARMVNRNRFTLAYPAILTSLLESVGIECDPNDIIENVKCFALNEKICKKASDIPVPDAGQTRESLFVRAKRMIKECSEDFAELAKKQVKLSSAIQVNQEKLDRAFAMLPDTWSNDEGDLPGPSVAGPSDRAPSEDSIFDDEVGIF